MDWLIRLLGGVPKVEHIRFRHECARFAAKHLRGRDFTLTGYAYHEELSAPEGVDVAEAAVVGSCVYVGAARNVVFVVAPWAEDVCIRSSSFIPSPAVESDGGAG